MKTEYTLEELKNEMSVLENTFTTVRLVNPKKCKICYPDSLFINSKQWHSCFVTWDKCRRCNNCISIRTLETHRSHSKMEYVNDRVYIIMSRYIVCEGKEFVMETMKDISDSMDVFSNGSAMYAFMDQTNNVITDFETGTYNRRYVDEHLAPFISQNRDKNVCMALIHIDARFGDEDFIKKTAEYLNAGFSDEKNICIRYDRNEFLVVSIDSETDAFRKKIEKQENREKFKIGIAEMSEIEGRRDIFSLIALADKRVSGEKNNIL
ncbi:MAG: hypothetical protein J1F64_07930 [Oscillospiraceae bacterium]|nr:hypothetical protein [Oscillospiraceae bacterium]